jgi:hypothetical protein
VTTIMAGFTWDFGAGRTGGFLDSTLGGGLGNFLFNTILRNTTQNPATNGASITFNNLSGLMGSFPNSLPDGFCWGTLDATDCGVGGLSSNGSYKFSQARALPRIHDRHASRGDSRTRADVDVVARHRRRWVNRKAPAPQTARGSGQLKQHGSV